MVIVEANFETTLPFGYAHPHDLHLVDLSIRSLGVSRGLVSFLFLGMDEDIALPRGVTQGVGMIELRYRL